jgi:F-box protein 9
LTREEDDDYVQSQPFEDVAAAAHASSLETGHPESSQQGDPVSALDHYEKAVEREAVGNLGDSLQLYRKAFRVRPATP